MTLDGGGKHGIELRLGEWEMQQYGARVRERLGV